MLYGIPHKNHLKYVCVMPYNRYRVFRLFKTETFADWYKDLDVHTQKIVYARLTRIEQEGHFGTVNRFDGITELKWKSGLRIYTAVLAPNVFVLLGGNKNGQEKDIRKAKKILGKINPFRP